MSGGKPGSSADMKQLVLLLECSRLIEWWEASGSVDIEQLVLPLECSRLIEC